MSKSFMNVAVGTETDILEPLTPSESSRSVKKKKRRNMVKEILNSKKESNQEKAFQKNLDEIIFAIKGETMGSDLQVPEKVELIKSLLNIPKAEIFKSQDEVS
jgi:hypothetical protein